MWAPFDWITATVCRECDSQSFLRYYGLKAFQSVLLFFFVPPFTMFKPKAPKRLNESYTNCWHKRSPSNLQAVYANRICLAQTVLKYGVIHLKSQKVLSFYINHQSSYRSETFCFVLKAIALQVACGLED